MSGVRTFWIEPIGIDACYLRRFVFGEKRKCASSPGGYHNASVRIEDGPSGVAIGDSHPHTDPRWPERCSCGYVFQEEDEWQLFRDRIYRRLDTGDLAPHREMPVGALWNAEYLAGRREYTGADGLSVHCRTPGGDWCIDSRARNCTLPDDHAHKCWVRHGTFGQQVHVDKNGLTCKAGAGSIQTGNYHGFLHHGVLT